MGSFFDSFFGLLVLAVKLVPFLPRLNSKFLNNFFSNYNFVVLDCAKVKIGNNVFIAPNVGIYCAGHPLNVAERNKGLEYAKPITIGNNVWIGAGVQICPGVSIGDNSTIGAGSIVTKDIPANVVAVGNPCRVLREIGEKDREYYFKDRKIQL